MSYALAVGTVEPWGRYAAETDEVYLWRATLSGANIRSLQDMQAIAAAIGRNQGLGLDLRGIAVEPAAATGSYQLDAAFTTKRFLVYTPGFATADDIAAKAKVELAERFPGLQISAARFEEINDTAPKHHSLDFWLSHTIIWNIPSGGLLPHLEKGSPTDAFARFEGLYRGSATDGANLKKWQPPLPPNGKNGPLPNGGEPTQGDSTLLWVMGGVIAVWILSSRTSKGAGAAS